MIEEAACVWSLGYLGSAPQAVMLLCDRALAEEYTVRILWLCDTSHAVEFSMLRLGGVCVQQSFPTLLSLQSGSDTRAIIHSNLERRHWN